MSKSFRVWNGHRMMNVEDGWQLIFFSGKGKIPWGLYDHTNARVADGQYGDVLMRYTTLKDMNGVEICEGDIVKWGHMKGHGEERPIRVAEVRIDPDIQFKAHHKQTGGPHIFHYGTFAYADTHNWLVVIGNIYEHPELLLAGKTKHDEEAKRKLIAAGRQDLVAACELNESGYAGINRNGTIVNRRIHPDAIPVPANPMFNVPEPKPLDTTPMSDKMNLSIYGDGAELDPISETEAHHARIMLAPDKWLDFRMGASGAIELYSSGNISINLMASNRMDVILSDR